MIATAPLREAESLAETTLTFWTEPPQHLWSLLSVEEWQAYHAVPLHLDTEGLVVVAATEDVGSFSRRLRIRTSQPIHVVPAAPEAIDFWLAVAEGKTWEQALAACIATLARQVGVARGSARLDALSDTPRLSADNVARAYNLHPAAALELLSLAVTMPSIRLEQFVPPPYLSTLLTADQARALRVVPVLASRGRLLVASPIVHGPAERQILEELFGATLQIALCLPEIAARSLDELFGPPLPPDPPDPDFLAFAAPDDLTALRGLRESRQAAVLQVSTQEHLAPAETALRHGYLTPRDVAHAEARTLGLTLLVTEQPRVDVSLAQRLSPTLWKRWGLAPVREHEHGHPVLACSQSPEPALLRTIASLLHVPVVVPRYIPEEELAPLLADLPSLQPPPRWTPDEILITSGRVSQDRLATARSDARDLGLPGALQALVQDRFFSPDDVAEVTALAGGFSWVHLDYFRAATDVLDLLPPEEARATNTLPLLFRHGHLVRAYLAPATPPPFTAADEAVLAIPPAVPDLFRDWYGTPPDVSLELEEFGAYLVRKGLLTRSQLYAAWDRFGRGEPLDVVLCTGPDALAPDLLLEAFVHVGAAAGVEDLSLRPRTVAVLDALGEERARLVWDDPVDREAASMLPVDVARYLPAIPVRLTPEGAVEVVVADPLGNPALARELAPALGRPVVFKVATRQQIEVALHRVFDTRSLGERLLANGVITAPQLERALRSHNQTGVRLGRILVNLGFVSHEEIAATLADQLKLPFVDLRAAEPDPEMVRLIPEEFERSRGLLPLFDDGEHLVVGFTDSPSSSGVDELPALLGDRPMQVVIIAEAALDDALASVYRDEYMDQATSLLVTRSPEDSARWVLTRGQAWFFRILVVVIILALIFETVAAATVLVSLTTLFYAAFSLYKFYVTYRALTHVLEVATTDEEVDALDERNLPIYTILVPVYQETEVFPILARAIARLDYPKAKLDVKILLEEDDPETIAVARASNLPSHFQLVIVPNGKPKGKPKACNYGLIQARGEYAVIFDAEDIPEPDQLKKAIVAFRKSDESLVCVQAKLNYFNRDQNLLTRWFTTEYAMWFDLMLPGLDASGAPIPLGGTSNHFKVARLRELGAWDPHNVTEDADLGIRLYKVRWKTAVIDSTTYEEANSQVGNWIRQRSRWVKGYIQTYLVHMRHPIKLIRSIGFGAFISFQLVVGGTFFGFLMNPVMWVLTAVWFIFHWAFIQQIFPAPIFYIGSLGLYIGNFTFTYLNVAGCLRRKYYDMVRYALLSPLYWALMSVAAWKGFLQLFYAPSYWEKTRHGLSHSSATDELLGGPSA